MAGAIRQYCKYKVQVQVVPNYGLVYLLDRDLRKQLDDLIEMRRMNHNIKQSSSY